MNLYEIKRLYGSHLERNDGSAMIGVEALKFLVKEAETLEKIRVEAQDYITKKLIYRILENEWTIFFNRYSNNKLLIISSRKGYKHGNSGQTRNYKSNDFYSKT